VCDCVYGWVGLFECVCNFEFFGTCACVCACVRVCVRVRMCVCMHVGLIAFACVRLRVFLCLYVRVPSSVVWVDFLMCVRVRAFGRVLFIRIRKSSTLKG